MQKKLKTTVGLPGSSCVLTCMVFAKFSPPSWSLCRAGWQITTRNRKHRGQICLRGPFITKHLSFTARTDASVSADFAGLLLPQAFPKINISFLEKPRFLWSVSIWPTCVVCKKKQNKKNKTLFRFLVTSLVSDTHKKGGTSANGQVRNTSLFTGSGQTRWPWIQSKGEVLGSLSPRLSGLVPHPRGTD